MHWGVAFGRDVFGVDGEEEGEAEEGDDYQVDEADADGGGGGGWGEGAEVVDAEAYGWVEGLRGGGVGCGSEVGVGEDTGDPLRAEGGLDLGLELVKNGDDVVCVGILVAGLVVDDLTGAERVVVGIACTYGVLEEGGCVVVDDDGCPDVLFEDGKADCHGVIVIHCRTLSDETEMARFPSCHLGGLYDCLTDKWCRACIWS